MLSCNKMFALCATAALIVSSIAADDGGITDIYQNEILQNQLKDGGGGGMTPALTPPVAEVPQSHDDQGQHQQDMPIAVPDETSGDTQSAAPCPTPQSSGDGQQNGDGIVVVVGGGVNQGGTGDQYGGGVGAGVGIDVGLGGGVNQGGTGDQYGGVGAGAGVGIDVGLGGGVNQGETGDQYGGGVGAGAGVGIDVGLGGGVNQGETGDQYGGGVGIGAGVGIDVGLGGGVNQGETGDQYGGGVGISAGIDVGLGGVGISAGIDVDVGLGGVGIGAGVGIDVGLGGGVNQGGNDGQQYDQGAAPYPTPETMGNDQQNGGAGNQIFAQSPIDKRQMPMVPEISREMTGQNARHLRSQN